MAVLQIGRTLMWCSQLLLLAVLLTAAVCTRREWAPDFAYLLWIPLMLVVLAASALSLLRRRHSAPLTFNEIFPKHVLASVLLAGVVSVPQWGPEVAESSLAPDGSIVFRHEWYASADRMRYYERFNRRQELEITKARFQELEQGATYVSVRLWTLFAVVVLILSRIALINSEAEPPKAGAP